MRARASVRRRARRACRRRRRSTRSRELFGLSAFERDLLLLCAGRRDGRRPRRAVRRSAAAGRGGRGPTFGLALAALAEPHWSALAPVRPLRRWRLIEVDDGAGLTHGAAAHRRARAALPRRRSTISTRGCARCCGRVPPPARAGRRAHGARSRERCAPALRARPAGCRCCSSPATTRTASSDVAARVARAARPAAATRCAPTTCRRTPARAARRWPRCGEREAALLGGARCSSSATTTRRRRRARRLAERVGGLRRSSARASRWRCATRRRCASSVDKPDARRAAARCGTRRWAPAPRRSNGALDGVAAQFRLSARRIAADRARRDRRCAASDARRGAVGAPAARRARRGSTTWRSGSSRAPRWDDLVLPDAAAGHAARDRRARAAPAHGLRRLGLRRARARAASASARCSPARAAPARRWPPRCWPTSCGLDLYRIDLSPVVSKYIGETEKNLRARLRRRRGRRRGPAVRRGRRAVRQAQRGQGQPRPLRQHRGQLPAAAHGGVPRPGDPDHQP